jgi:hypothetical protein
VDQSRAEPFMTARKGCARGSETRRTDLDLVISSAPWLGLTLTLVR